MKRKNATFAEVIQLSQWMGNNLHPDIPHDVDDVLKKAIADGINVSRYTVITVLDQMRFMRIGKRGSEHGRSLTVRVAALEKRIASIEETLGADQ